MFDQISDGKPLCLPGPRHSQLQYLLSLFSGQPTKCISSFGANKLVSHSNVEHVIWNCSSSHHNQQQGTWEFEVVCNCC